MKDVFMAKKNKLDTWDQMYEHLIEASSLLKDMESSPTAQIKKAESILKKTATVAQKDKNLAPFFYQISGIVSFLEKDFKTALSQFSKAVKMGQGSSGEPYVWLSYVYLHLNQHEECFKFLAEAYKNDKQTKAIVKKFKSFSQVQSSKGYKEALGILSKIDLEDKKIDPMSKKMADFILETPDWEWYQLYGLSKKNKLKFKDKASYWDIVITALSPAIEDALEHNLALDDIYDDMYSLKFLKDTLLEAKTERKKLGKKKSYFLNEIKSVI
jgi:tetratricopeptide (TPR) repeat protein